MIRRTFAILFIVFCAYCGAYWWFRMSRTVRYISSPVPSVYLPGSGRLSVLTHTFRPLICIDGYLSNSTFFLVDSDGRTILGDHPYPFARVRQDASPWTFSAAQRRI